MEYHWKERKIENVIPQTTHDSLHCRSQNLRDSQFKAKLPTREKNDYTYDDLVTNEEDPPSSPTLHTLQDLDLGIKGFNMFIDFEEIEEDQNTQGPTPSNRRQDHEDHSSHPSEH